MRGLNLLAKAARAVHLLGVNAITSKGERAHRSR
jgi:hypothetical protein